ncbi:MAG: alpha/beta hydrolase, partial [bacterium]|nr:alpha/beta hydrolase [bacterium]
GWKLEGEDLQENRQGLREAWRAGDFEQAVEFFQRSWTDGHRSPEEVDPEVRRRIRTMALENLQRGRTVGRFLELDPPAVERLADIRAPTLIILGLLDMSDVHAISDRLVTQVEGAKKVDVPDVAHVVNMEKPEEFNRMVLEFLSGL